MRRVVLIMAAGDDNVSDARGGGGGSSSSNTYLVPARFHQLQPRLRCLWQRRSRSLVPCHNATIRHCINMSKNITRIPLKSAVEAPYLSHHSLMNLLVAGGAVPASRQAMLQHESTSFPCRFTDK